MGEAEAATLFTKAPKIAEKVKDVIKLPTKYADVDTTSPDFINYVEKFQIQNISPQNQKTAYSAFNTVKNNFFDKNKNYDGF